MIRTALEPTNCTDTTQQILGNIYKLVPAFICWIGIRKAINDAHTWSIKPYG